ncbi:MAG: hypothetical protein SW833_28395 [Cyanobacteriota bacterium]|nr:hypothetical protein [Cyanobacteriota bacterium]
MRPLDALTASQPYSPTVILSVGQLRSPVAPNAAAERRERDLDLGC